MVQTSRNGLWLVVAIAACGGRVERLTEGMPPGGTDAGGQIHQAGSQAAGGIGGVGGAVVGGAVTAGAAGIGAVLDEGGAAGDEAIAGEGGEGGGSDWFPDAPRLLTQFATEGEWFGKDPIHGLVVTRSGTLFLETSYKIYEINGAQVSVYLTEADTLAALGNHGSYGFGDLGLDAQGTLYATYAGSIARVNIAHEPVLWRADPGTASAPVLRLRALERASRSNLRLKGRLGIDEIVLT